MGFSVSYAFYKNKENTSSKRGKTNCWTVCIMVFHLSLFSNIILWTIISLFCMYNCDYICNLDLVNKWYICMLNLKIFLLQVMIWSKILFWPKTLSLVLLLIWIESAYLTLALMMICKKKYKLHLMRLFQYFYSLWQIEKTIKWHCFLVRNTF